MGVREPVGEMGREVRGEKVNKSKKLKKWPRLACDKKITPGV